jgi:hypothetical protein
LTEVIVEPPGDPGPAQGTTVNGRESR